MKRNINSSLWAVAAFSASVGLGSVASSAHAAPFQPASVYDPDETGWSSLRDMTAAQLDAANEARKANNMMVDVDVVNVGGQLRYAAVWKANSDGRAWAVVKDLTSAQFGDKWESLSNDGYMLIDQESYASGSNQLYAGIFVKNVEGTGWASLRNMTSDTFNDKFEYYRGLGYMPVDFDVYKMNGSDLIACIWVKNTNNVKWAFKRALSSDAFGTWFDQMKDDYRVLEFESYRVGNDQRYGAIFVENTNGRYWVERRDMTEKQFGDNWKRYADEGYRLINFKRYDYSSGTRYAGVWRQNTVRPGWEHRAAVDKLLEDALAAKGIPGMSVAVMQGGEFLYLRGLGFSDVGADEIASSSTIFRLASVSKGVSGILALDLEERGLINLANKTRSYESNLPTHHTHTVAQTLTMRAGLGHYETYGSRTKGPYSNAYDPTKEIWDTALVRSVGKYGYSTHSYMFSALAMEGALNKDIFAIYEDEFRARYGLGTLRPEDLSVSLAERSRVYDSATHAVTPDDITWKVLGGGLESSVVDLTRLVDRIQRGQILTAANRERLWTPVSGTTGYGFGWELTSTNTCTRNVRKSGGQLGASSYVLVYPELGVTITVLINREGISAREIADDIGALVKSTECP